MTLSRVTARSLLALLLACTQARADLIDIGDYENRPLGRFGALHKRMAEHPNAVDRADALCDGRAPGTACTVAGSAFDGGGAGACTRQASLADQRIDLVCVPHVIPIIDRGLPSGPWQPEASFCSTRPYGPDSMAVLDWQCTPPAEISDRFCVGTAVGGKCTVGAAVAGVGTSFEGVCTRHVESKAEESIGVLLSRPVVTCESAHPASRELITYGVWRKLFQ